MSRLIILDRDGVINQDSDAYIKSLAEWQPLPGSIEAIARLSRAGYTVVVATNQSGLARGYFTQATLDAIHGRLRALVEQAGGELGGIYYCPHGPDDHCDCRKPKPGLLDQIVTDYGNVSGAPMIGDSLRDLEAGVARDCHPVLVLTGKGERTREKGLPASLGHVTVCRSLKDYAEKLLH